MGSLDVRQEKARGKHCSAAGPKGFGNLATSSNHPGLSDQQSRDCWYSEPFRDTIP